MTLTDPKTEYAPCPWCGQPGRLIVRPCFGRLEDGRNASATSYRVGCRNQDCLVKPRTSAIYILNIQSDDSKQGAIKYSIERWERRNGQKTNN